MEIRGYSPRCLIFYMKVSSSQNVKIAVAKVRIPNGFSQNWCFFGWTCSMRLDLAAQVPKKTTQNFHVASKWSKHSPSLIWVCLKMSCTPKPNGFADHYPILSLLNGYNWEYTLFSDKPIWWSHELTTEARKSGWASQVGWPETFERRSSVSPQPTWEIGRDHVSICELFSRETLGKTTLFWCQKMCWRYILVCLLNVAVRYFFLISFWLESCGKAAAP